MNSTKSVSDLLDEGLSLHQADKIEEAGALYRQVLLMSSEHPEAWHYLVLSGEPAGGFPSWFVVKR